MVRWSRSRVYSRFLPHVRKQRQRGDEPKYQQRKQHGATGLPNRAAILDLLTTVSDHLPVVVDYRLAGTSSIDVIAYDRGTYTQDFNGLPNTGSQSLSGAGPISLGSSSIQARDAGLVDWTIRWYFQQRALCSRQWRWQWLGRSIQLWKHGSHRTIAREFGLR